MPLEIQVYCVRGGSGPSGYRGEGFRAPGFYGIAHPPFRLPSGFLFLDFGNVCYTFEGILAQGGRRESGETCGGGHRYIFTVARVGMGRDTIVMTRRALPESLQGFVTPEELGGGVFWATFKGCKLAQGRDPVSVWVENLKGRSHGVLILFVR